MGGERTATLWIESDGEIVFRNFDGKEYEIDTARTRIQEVKGAEYTAKFIADLLNRTIMDSIVLTNFDMNERKTKSQRAESKAKAEAAAKARRDGPRVFVNKADREMHEEAIRRLK